MKTYLNRFVAFAAAALAGGAMLTSCLSDGDDTISLGTKPATDIPDDSDAEPAPVVYEDNTVIPNIQYGCVDEDGNIVFRIDMTGVQGGSAGDWLRLLGTNMDGQNIWVEIDGVPKGVMVYNASDNQNERQIPIDLVFLVDNSGSMSEEANTIAEQIVTWASLLNSALDVRFGCVGYDGEITGARDISDLEVLDTFLNRPDISGTFRTVGFDDEDLKEAAPSYYNHYNECGMAALRYADENFHFRNGANRIYVNFTDEPNQANGVARFSVESLKTDWDTNRGTIHTVFSDGRETSTEYNYLMSTYTGGTVINTNRSFTGVTLSSLPVTDAMQNSYVIRLSNIENLFDGRPHEVTITIYDSEKRVWASRTFYVIFTRPEE